MQVCTSLQTDDHASTPPLSFLQAGCPSCHPTNSIKALKANVLRPTRHKISHFGDVLPSKSLGSVQKKVNATQINERVARVTAGLAESNGSLPLGL